MQKTAICAIEGVLRPGRELRFNTPNTGSPGTFVQLLRIMRMIAFLLFVVCLHVSAKTSSQTISLSCKRISIQSVFTTIEKQTGYVVFYKKNLLDKSKQVSISVKDMPLAEFMEMLLRNQPLLAQIEGSTIILSAKRPEVKIERVFVPEDLIAPPAGIEGVIKSANGQPLSNASVKVKNSRLGTTTSANGQFSLKSLPDDAILQISMIGYEPLDVKIRKTTNGYVAFAVNPAQTNAVNSSVGETVRIQITLTEAAKEMVEVVVRTGIVNRKSESFTGAATTVKGDELRRVGNINIFQSLKNLDPTIYIMESMSMGSNPNALPDMNMRGGTSFDESIGDVNLKGNYQNRPNQPLFILDGFETTVERVFDLDMNTVESLTILKDASAKALYGSKAANGVVVIETKKLNASKPRISYSGSLDVTMPDLSSYDLLNATEKLDLEFRENVYPDTDPVALANYYRLRKTAQQGLNTYWLSKPVRMGYGQKHALSIDLGKDELRTNINLSQYDNVGVMKGSGRKTLTGGFNLLYTIKKFRFQNRLNLTNNKAEDSPYGAFGTYTTLNPYLNPYDEFGDMLVTLPNGKRNPLNDGTIGTSLTSKYFEVTNNFETEYDITRGLKARARFSLTRKNNNADRYYPATHSMFVAYADSNSFRKGQYEANYGNNNRISGDFYLNYNTTINAVHNVFFNGGVNMSENKFREEVHYAEGFPSVYMSDIMFAYQYNSERIRPSGISGFTREMGVLAMGSYTYMDRFLFDGTYRLNSSSVFGNQNRFAAFWSLGLGWNMHKEDFLKEYAAIKQLKIRGSVGTSGNQNFLNNKSLTVNNYYLSDRYATLIGSYAANMENPELKWESKMDYNVGMDADIHGVTLKIDAYKTITQNMVTSISTAPSIGYTNVSDNLGKVENKGIEIGLSYTVFQNKKGFLRINGAYAANKNTILEISEAMRTFNQKQLAAVSDRSTNTIMAGNSKPVVLYYDGLPMNTIWAVPSYGIDPATGIELLGGKNGDTYIWKASDMVPSGISVPKWRGNVGFNGEYKGIGLSVICTYLGGGQLYNQMLVDKLENVDIANNFDRRVLTDRWMTPGQMTQFKRNVGATPYDMRNGIYFYGESGWNQEPTRSTQRFVQNQNELNISSITLSYDFERRWLKKFGMERLKFSTYMNDLVKFSTIGIERGTTYPFARTISFKLNATF